MEEIIIQTNDEKMFIIVLESGKIVEYYGYYLNCLPKIGNIYIGTIKDVLASSNTIFVEFGDEKPGYLQLESFNQKYKNGDKIIVQVKKDAINSKGAKLSNELTISGKYVVLLINSNIYTVSQKISYPDIDGLFGSIKEFLPSSFGVIIRTEAQNVEKSDIIKEVKLLYEKYLAIDELIKNKDVGLVYESANIENKVLFDISKQTTKKIYVNNMHIYSKILSIIEEVKTQGEMDYFFPEIIYSDGDFLQEFGLITEFDKIFDRKIWLKSSGYIVIDKTEALTSIDVNSGKFLGNNTNKKEDIALKVNLEAGIEAMKQIRLKNIGGIIIIDFINMENESSKEEVIKALREESLKDRSKVEILGFTKLGLVEITRKKI